MLRAKRKKGPNRLRRTLSVVLFLGILLPVLYVAWYRLEWTPPEVKFQTLPTVLGRKASLELEAWDTRSGLRSLEVFLRTKEGPYLLFAEKLPLGGWLGSPTKAFSRSLTLDLTQVPEGPATLEVFAQDASWLSYFRSLPPRLVHEVEVDLTPPALEVLSSQHYVRLGGCELVVYRSSADAVRSGVEVDGYFFPGIRGLFPDATTYVALFAIPQDLSPKVRPRLVAWDAAQNQRQVYFFCSIRPQRFSQRTLEISDAFLERKVPEIVAASGLGPFPNSLEGYLYINRTLRQQTEERVREVCRSSASRPLWEGPFLQQAGTKVMSGFADRRTYLYRGKEIDVQTHLGYDLASLRNSPVVAANTGKVVWAGNLGIYGNCVIIDHGLGLFSLYGHLSSVGVREGQEVKKGEVIGRSGESGLAGGDHLHFSIMLYGVHVDPMEWWDGKWLKDHIQAKLPPSRERPQPIAQ